MPQSTFRPIRRILLALVLTLAAHSPAPVAAQTWSVTPITNYVSDYADRRLIILNHVQASNLPLDEQLQMYESRMSGLRQEFRDARRAEYESKAVSVSANHSCTKGYSGGRKDCGWRCTAAPSPELHTRAEWVSAQGQKNLRVTTSEACIHLHRAGRGRSTASVAAVYRYRPEVVAKRVDDETTELFRRITSTRVTQ